MLNGELVGFLFKCGFLNFKLHYLVRNFVHFGRHGVHFRLDKRASLVYQVYRLIGQKSVGDIPVGKSSGGNYRVVVYLYSVINLVPLFKTSQNGYSVLNRRLIDHNGLITSFKSRVFFDIFSVFVKRCCTYAMELTPCKHRL